MYNVDVDGSSLLHLAVNSGVLGVRMFMFASCFSSKMFSEEWNSNFRNFQKRGQPHEVYSDFRKFLTENSRSI